MGKHSRKAVIGALVAAGLALAGAAESDKITAAACSHVVVCNNGSGTVVVGPPAAPDGSQPHSTTTATTVPSAPTALSTTAAVTSPAAVSLDRLERYCAQWRMTPVLRSADAHGWRCTRPGAQDISVSMTQLCALEFGQQWVDRYADFGNPDSWECYTV